MKRRRNACGRAQAARRSVSRQHQRVEALLHVQVTLHPNASCERDELGTARKEDVLTVVDFVPVDFKGSRASTEEPAAFKEFDVSAGVFEFQRGRQTGQSGTDDRYPLLLSHDLTTTRSFSLFDSAARPRSGSAGSRSIFLSSSS